jgi:uncharacterized protein (DUF486 family)
LSSDHTLPYSRQGNTGKGRAEVFRSPEASATLRREIRKNPSPSVWKQSQMPGSATVQAIILLAFSNVFMTFAWYAHLRNLQHKEWYVAALISWCIALFEYLLQVPANRIGYTELRLDQLKILQEVISLAIFVPFAVLYMKKAITLDYLWASLCVCGAVFFIFRGGNTQ